MEDSQKKTQKSEHEKKKKKRKKKTTKKQKKVKIHRKNVQKRYSFKRRGSKKIGDTIIEYKRDVKHNEISKKHFRKSRVFFFKDRKNDGTFQKRRFFFLVQEAEKQKIGDAKKKTTKNVQKKRRNQKHLYSEGRKNGTRKDMCFLKKKERQQTEKGKRKREMKSRS